MGVDKVLQVHIMHVFPVRILCLFDEISACSEIFGLSMRAISLNQLSGNFELTFISFFAILYLQKAPQSIYVGFQRGSSKQKTENLAPCYKA